MVSIGIITALGFEARIAARQNLFTIRRCAIAGRDVESVVRELAASDHELIVSWGTAGALSPEVRAGDICLPEQIITRSGSRIATDSDWRTRFLETVKDSCPVRSGSLADSSHIIANPDEKRGLGRSTGADAVDMESGPIGRVCEHLHIPFLVVRAIVDELDDRLPRHVARQIGTGSSLRPAAVLGGFVLRPRHWGKLARLVRRYNRSKTSLAVAAEALSRCADNRG